MLLSHEISVVSILAGMFLAFLVSLSMGHLFTEHPKEWLEPKRYLYFLQYLFIFLFECIRANFDVALRVIKPNMPINPGIVKVKTKLKTEVALTFLANSITLTPGTLCVDVDKDEQILYIHWIDVKDIDMVRATNIIVTRFEGVIGKVFE